MIDLENLEKAYANWKHAEKNWTNEVMGAAARELLAGEKIWYCQVHSALEFKTGKLPHSGFCWVAYYMDAHPGIVCVMVPALLLINGEGKE